MGGEQARVWQQAPQGHFFSLEDRNKNRPRVTVKLDSTRMTWMQSAADLQKGAQREGGGQPVGLGDQAVACRHRHHLLQQQPRRRRHLWRMARHMHWNRYPGTVLRYLQRLTWSQQGVTASRSSCHAAAVHLFSTSCGGCHRHIIGFDMQRSIWLHTTLHHPCVAVA